MMRLDASLWIGGSGDEVRGSLYAVGIKAILNVACDMKCTRSWDDSIEYMHIGLIDGPGNEVGDYCAAVLGLKALVRRHDCVMVCDHAMRRALVVALMYFNLTEGQWRPNPMDWSHWPTWKERVGIVSSKVDIPLPDAHKAHIEIFDKMPWGVLEVL